MNGFYEKFEPYEMTQGVLVTGHVLIGHNVSNIGINDTSITPAFRQSRLFAATCVGYGRDKEKYDESMYDFMNEYRLKVDKYSLGSYWNEDWANNSHFINDYWSKEHYQRLQTIKTKYDPNPSLFNCNECVTATN